MKAITQIICIVILIIQIFIIGFLLGDEYNKIECSEENGGEECRLLTIQEYEKLQTLPVGYTEGVSDNERFKMVGNAWTLEVIKHLFKPLLKDSLNTS
jgi:site-specific DNA-cytosine methylase